MTRKGTKQISKRAVVDNEIRDLQLLKAADISKADPNANLPQEWVNAYLGPGFPIRPVQSIREERPREIDYPVAINVSLAQRDAYGLMSFPTIAMAASIIPELQMCENLINRQMSMMVPQLVDDKNDPISDHEYQWIIQYPDRRTPWTIWYSRWLQNVLRYDAPAVHFEKDGNGYLNALNYVDGSTLLLWIDESGRPPFSYSTDNDGATVRTPAYTQIIKGTASAWYTIDEIMYQPRFPRLDSPYGTSPVEMAWVWVQMIANLEGFELSYYREGNMPEGWATLPKDWSVTKIEQFEKVFNASMSVGPAERRRIRFLPEGTTVSTTKKSEWQSELYKAARNNIAMAYGIPAYELGEQPNSGLGGKGFGDSMQTMFSRQVVLPIKAFTENYFNQILHKFNINDVKFTLSFPQQTIDPEARKATALELMQYSVFSINEARAYMGMKPIGSLGDTRILLKSPSPIRLEDIISGDLVAGKLKAADEVPPALDPNDKEPLNPTPASLTPTETPSKTATLTKYVTVLQKHCGVCPEDDEYYDAEVIAPDTIAWPDVHHANDVQIVTMQGKDLSPRPAVFKPSDGENSNLVARIGGAQYKREEAAYLMDRALASSPDRYLVPVTYIADVKGVDGSVQMYVQDNATVMEPKEYSPEWSARAALLDYVIGSIDRHRGNWITHPEDDKRPILIDNGLSFPSEEQSHAVSPFVDLWRGQTLPTDVLAACGRCAKDAVWPDLGYILDRKSIDNARKRLEAVVEAGKIPE